MSCHTDPQPAPPTPPLPPIVSLLVQIHRQFSSWVPVVLFTYQKYFDRDNFCPSTVGGYYRPSPTCSPGTSSDFAQQAFLSFPFPSHWSLLTRPPQQQHLPPALLVITAGRQEQPRGARFKYILPLLQIFILISWTVATPNPAFPPHRLPWKHLAHPIYPTPLTPGKHDCTLQCPFYRTPRAKADCIYFYH